METPVIFNESSNVIQQFIISIGTSVYSQYFQGLTDDEILHKYHSSTSDTIVQVLQDEISQLQHKFNETKVSHSEELLSLQQSVVAKVDSETETIKQQHAKEIEMNGRNISLENKMKDEMIQFLKKTNNTNDTVIRTALEKRDFKNSKEKGDYAEHWLQNITNKGLPFDSNSFMDDTSEEYGSGDGILHIPEYKCRIMIEMKNKTAIDEDDLKQFEEHYSKDLGNNKIDLAILISFNCKNIRRHGCCLAHKYDDKDKRVIYYSFSECSTLEEKEQKLIDTLHEICERYKYQSNISQESIQETNESIQYIEDRLKHLKSEEMFLKSQEKDTNKQILCLKERTEQIMKQKFTFIKQLWDNGMINKIDPSLVSGNEDTLKKMLIQKLKQHMEEHSINLVPKQKNGNRPLWNKKLKESLQFPLEGYESFLFDKLKHTDICD